MRDIRNFGFELEKNKYEVDTAKCEDYTKVEKLSFIKSNN